MKLNENVTVRMKSLHEGETEAVEVISSGMHCIRDGKHIVTYTETPDETKAVSECVLRFNEKELEITKEGDYRMQLYFVQGMPTIGYYQTPFGDFQIETKTEQLEMKDMGERIEILLCFEDKMNQTPVPECSMLIVIEKTLQQEEA